MTIVSLALASNLVGIDVDHALIQVQRLLENAGWSAASSICFVVGLPCPWSVCVSLK